MYRFIKALEGRDSFLIHKEARKEAKRQVTEMTKWLTVQEKTNADAVDPDIGLYAPLVPIIKKAEKYQTKIYNETKKIKPLEEKLALAQARGDFQLVVECNDKLAEIEANQWALCWKILKIYCFVSTSVVLEQGVAPVEYVREEYTEEVE